MRLAQQSTWLTTPSALHLAPRRLSRGAARQRQWPATVAASPGAASYDPCRRAATSIRASAAASEWPQNGSDEPPTHHLGRLLAWLAGLLAACAQLWRALCRWAADGWRAFTAGCRQLWRDLWLAQSMAPRALRLAGPPLSRRERLFLGRVGSDMAKLLPFGLIVVVPFAELALPLLLRVFPAMLPSVFDDPARVRSIAESRQHRQAEAATLALQLLQQRADTRGDPPSVTDESPQMSPDDRHGPCGVAALLALIQPLGPQAPRPSVELVGGLRALDGLFHGPLSLGSLQGPELRCLCSLLGLPPGGSPAAAAQRLAQRMASLRADDAWIAREGGVGGLEEAEVAAASLQRGLPAGPALAPAGDDAADAADGRAALRGWLQLSGDKTLPPSALLFWAALAWHARGVAGAPTEHSTPLVPAAA